MKTNDQKDRDLFLSKLDDYLNRGLDQMALSLTVERLNRFPFDTDVKMAYCNILIKMGNNDEANKLIQELEGTFLRLSKIYAHMGDIHVSKGLQQEAITCYGKFLSLDPKSSIANDINEKINALAYGHEMTDDEISEDHPNDISQIAPHFRTLTMAELYIRQGHFDMAGDILKEILKKDSGNKIAMDMLQQITTKGNNKTPISKNLNISMVIAELEKWVRNINKITTLAT